MGSVHVRFYSKWDRGLQEYLGGFAFLSRFLRGWLCRVNVGLVPWYMWSCRTSPRESNTQLAEYRHYHVTCLSCEKDNGVLPEVQQTMVEKVRKQGVRVMKECAMQGTVDI